MALNTVSDIQTEVLVRTSRTTTDSFITDAMLQGWVRDAYKWVTGYRKWPMTERRDNTTSYSGTEENTYPTDFKSDGIRILQIGGKRLKKLNFEDYQDFKEDFPDSQERYFTDFGRTYFINPNIDLSGTITVWGQYSPSIDPTDLTATTVFSGAEEGGNDALVDKAISFLKEREHLQDEAAFYEQRAAAKLDLLWKKIQDEQYKYVTHRDNEGMWKRFDAVEGGFHDELFKRDQFF